MHVDIIFSSRTIPFSFFCVYTYISYNASCYVLHNQICQQHNSTSKLLEGSWLEVSATPLLIDMRSWWTGSLKYSIPVYPGCILMWSGVAQYTALQYSQSHFTLVLYTRFNYTKLHLLYYSLTILQSTAWLRFYFNSSST